MSSKIQMPMPMPSSPSSPKPSAPTENLLPSTTKISSFLKAEDLNSSLPYPTISNNYFYLKLPIKRDWNAGFSIKDSPVFTIIAREVEGELKSLLGNEENLKIFVVHVQKDRFSSRRILLTILIQTTMKFDVEKLEKKLKEHLNNEEKIVEIRAYARDMKLRKIQVEEFEHLRNYGCNPCAVCDQVLIRHRKIDVNHPSVLSDILFLLVVLLSLALIVCILLLIFIK